jgi:dolichol-phosphate mannosyltransferase
MDSARTTILVATYLEAENICRLIDELLKHQPHARILVMDDQSPDGTAELVRATFARLENVRTVVRTGARGYGHAMREGMRLFLEGEDERLITIDADLSHDPALTTRMLEQVPPGGLAIGSRYIHGVRAMNWAVGRLLTSIFGNRYVQTVTRLPVADCTSGFRCYTREALARLDLGRIRSNGYAFLVEVLYWLHRGGCELVEVPIVYRDRCFGESKLGMGILIESLILPWRLVLKPQRFAPLRKLGAGPPVVPARP